ncbi:PAS domain S-box protein [Haloarcula amylovorans]|uniref:PAS domain S-box protein n=1 Tax=Haloarcula amylovorans TaxID=2562280 RepID=UPI0010763182|nr:PAS domain S-box protein [Halomicroarcula amylolytica]
MGENGDIYVLHVDDETEFADVAAMHLERADDDIAVVTAASASEGLDVLRSDPVDCVVSDHDMPGMDGLEFLKAVRSSYPELPFVLFTGKGNEEIASDAISAGVTEYLQKDVGTDQYTVLANRIRRAVSENRAKSALEESERQLATLISNLPGLVYRCRNEPEWPMEFVSDGAEELVGYDSETLESGEVSWSSLIVADDRETLWEQVQTCIAASEPFEVTYRVETRDGERRWMWERGRVVGSDEDGVELIEGFITDITARKAREQELQREREFTENLVDAIDDVFYLVGFEGDLIRWNDTATEVTGYNDEELSSMSAFDLFPEPVHNHVAETVRETFETGHSTFEAPLLTKAGDEIRHEFRGSLIEDTDGNELGIAGIARDITERKARERKLEQYETLVENVGDAMYVLDTDGTIVMVNDAMSDRLGYDREKILGSDPTRFMPAADVETATETIARLLEDPERTWATFEMHTIDSDGERTVNEDKVAPLFDSDGEFVGSVGVLRNIADRKDRERELERYETIVEAVGDPVYTLDDDGVFTYVNEAIEQMTGYAAEELVGEHIGEIMTDDDLDRGDELVRLLVTDPDVETTTLEMAVVTRSGERIPTENNMAILPSADGEFTGTAGVIRNITKRKERERRLSEFASVVSHDLRNPLNVVQGRLSLAEETGDVSHLGDAAAAATRMERLIEDLLTLARQGETVGETAEVDLATTAERAWENVDTGDATLSFGPTTEIEADPDRLRELFENLIRNSVEHGSTSSRTGSDDSVEHGSTGTRSQAHENSVEHGTPNDDRTTPLTVTVGALDEGDSDGASGFYVEDDGVGIPPDEREGVFERGYTTSNGGTGFGLAIVADIADAHGWTVSVTESGAGGARVEFTTSRDDR